MVHPGVHAKPRVLLTGFEPFGGEALNPGWLTAKGLHRTPAAGHAVVAARLPTALGASLAALQRLLLELRPALLLCVGRAGGRGALSPERAPVNVNHARSADSAGAQPVAMAVVTGGPATCFSGLPIKPRLCALYGHGIAAQVPQTAGAFVCNHVFYRLVLLLATRAALRATRGGTWRRGRRAMTPGSRLQIRPAPEPAGEQAPGRGRATHLYI